MRRSLNAILEGDSATAPRLFLDYIGREVTDMRLSRYEAETQINFNEEEPDAVIYTASKAMIRKYEKLGLKLVEVKKDREGNVTGKIFKVPKGRVRISKPRVLSEEQKDHLRAAAKTRFSGQ